MTVSDWVHVPYTNTGLLVTGLRSNSVQVAFEFIAPFVGLVKAGHFRALAVTTRTRFSGLPDVPTVGDFVPGYEATSLFGVGAPKATPVGIIDRLNREINAALEDPKLRTRLVELGGTLLPGSPADFGKLVADDTEKWAKVIRAVNIKPE